MAGTEGYGLAGNFGFGPTGFSLAPVGSGSARETTSASGDRGGYNNQARFYMTRMDPMTGLGLQSCSHYNFGSRA